MEMQTLFSLEIKSIYKAFYITNISWKIVEKLLFLIDFLQSTQDT
jgi:hypothetical protein